MDSWRKSSYSHMNGECVEVAARWRKSSYSHMNGDCVEVAVSSPQVKIRDTQHRYLDHLAVPEAEWRAFLVAVRRGEL